MNDDDSNTGERGVANHGILTDVIFIFYFFLSWQYYYDEANQIVQYSVLLFVDEGVIFIIY